MTVHVCDICMMQKIMGTTSSYRFLLLLYTNVLLKLLIVIFEAGIDAMALHYTDCYLVVNPETRQKKKDACLAIFFPEGFSVVRFSTYR